MSNTNTNTIANIVLYQNEDDRFRGWEDASPRYHVRLLDVDRDEEWETIVSHGPGENHPEPQTGQKYYFCPADCGWVESSQVLEVFHVIG